MQEQVWKMLSHITKPPERMGLNFLPKPSIFVPDPQHQPVIENPENITQSRESEFPFQI